MTLVDNVDRDQQKGLSISRRHWNGSAVLHHQLNPFWDLDSTSPLTCD